MKHFWLLILLTVTVSLTATAQEQLIVAGGDGNDFGGDVAVDSNGDVIIVGAYSQPITFRDSDSDTTLGHQFSLDGFIARYGSDGSIKAADRISSSGQNIVTFVDVDASNNVVVSGTAGANTIFGSGPMADTIKADFGFGNAFIAHYAPDGTFHWMRSFGFVGMHGLAVSAAGDVYAAGTFQQEIWFPTSSGDTVFVQGQSNQNVRSAYMVKYAPDGEFDWVLTGKNSFSGIFVVGGLAADDNGAYMCAGVGATETTTLRVGTDSVQVVSSGFSDFLVAKVDRSGSLQWVQREGSAEASEGCNSIDVAADGSILVGGIYTVGSTEIGGQVLAPTESGSFLAKFTDTWDLQWAKASPLPITDQLAFHSDGSFSYFGDGLFGGDIRADVVLAKFSDTGTLQFLRLEGGAWDERVGGIAVSPIDGSVWITGSYATPISAGGPPNGSIFGCGDQMRVLDGFAEVFLAQYAPSPCGASTAVQVIGPNTPVPFSIDGYSGTLIFTTIGSSLNATIAYESGVIPETDGQVELLPLAYTIELDGTGTTANVTLPYLEVDLLAYLGLEGDLELFRDDSGQWTRLGGSVDTVANTVTLSGVEVFGRLAIGRTSVATSIDNPQPDLIDQIAIHVFPNPAGDRARIIIDADLSDANVSIYDLLGRKLWTRSVPRSAGGRLEMPVDLNGFGSGFYIIRVKNEENSGAAALMVH